MLKYDLISGFTGELLFTDNFEKCFDFLNNKVLARYHSGDYRLEFESLAPFESRIVAKYVKDEPVFYLKRNYNF